MRSEPSTKPEFFFVDPRLGMTLFGRFFVRVVTYISYLLLISATFTFLLSDIRPLRWLGLLLLLFLLDRFLHLREADRHLSEIPAAGRVNVAKYLGSQAYAVLERSYDRSLVKKTDLLLEVVNQLIQTNEAKIGLRRLDVKLEEFKAKLEELLIQSRVDGKHLSSMDRKAKIEELCLGALSDAIQNKQRFIEPADLFAALPHLSCEYLHRLFATFTLAEDDVSQAMIFGAAARQFSGLRTLPARLNAIVLGGEHGLRHRIMNRAWTSRPTPVLDSMSVDLTDAARGNAIGFLVGHDAEYEHLLKVLSRSDNPNAILVGDPGIGKDTIVEHLAFDLVKDRVPSALFDKRLVKLQLNALVAGAAPEELQNRVREMVAEMLLAGNVILYIPEIHNLVRTSGTAYLSAADALMPIIQNDAFPVIGSTYPREYKQAIEPRSDFTSVFETINIQEISEAEAQRILTYESLILERQKKIVISFGAVKSAVKLAKRYFRDKYLPTSAEELLKSAVVAAEEKGEKFLGPNRVIAVAEERINVPIHAATASEAEELLHLEEEIHKQLIDQEEAVSAVADALREYRSGLTRQGGPIASFLFIGPTGVGKTELAKILAKLQFGSEAAMVRFDMTEYQDKQSFYRFIGSPDGGVSGALTEAIIKRPFSLVLLDEFEKAFPDILNLFLQVLDDGRLTDNLGRTVDFTNTIIIATSNAHSDIINKALRTGQTISQISEYVKQKLTDIFKPELLNRFSKIIVFKDLDPQHVRQIAELNLKLLAKMLFDDQGIILNFSPEVVQMVEKHGFDPAFGARPLRRGIDERVRAPLAGLLLRQAVKRGQRVQVTIQGDECLFTPEAKL